MHANSTTKEQGQYDAKIFSDPVNLAPEVLSG